MIKKCQVFTPTLNVIELLNIVNYSSNLYGKKVIENACGDGNILTEIIKRYIEDALNNGIGINKIRHGLENDIYGAEIDKIHYKKCLQNLDNVANEYGINNVNWQLYNTDILKNELSTKFDYIIGNPPYISYRDLDEATRSFIKGKFKTCAYGKFDYCYAFIEASLDGLSDKGVLAYIIPNSIFKNVFAQELRNVILPYIVKILDYTTKKLFEQVLTSSAILVCSKANNKDYIEYENAATKDVYNIDKNSLTEKWVFTSNITQKPIKRFGDYFTASISIATLFNEAYVIKKFTIEKNFIKVGDYCIERGITKEGVSPRSLNYSKKELILFPYKYERNKLVRYKKEDFEKLFPEATKYLESFSAQLAKRKSDKSVEWFEYGRTQALAHLNQPKLLLSTVVTKEVKVYQLSNECIPYSGIYVIPKADMPLSFAKELLESDLFYKYVQGIGINANGKSLRITAVDINNFGF